MWKEFRKILRNMDEIIPLEAKHEDADTIADLDRIICLFYGSTRIVISNLLEFISIEDISEIPEEKDTSDPNKNFNSTENQLLNKEQNRNLTALSHLKQIKAKLEGRLDSQKLEVKVHVQKLIEAARSDENLAVMFEGWMGWI